MSSKATTTFETTRVTWEVLMKFFQVNFHFIMHPKTYKPRSFPEPEADGSSRFSHLSFLYEKPWMICEVLPGEEMSGVFSQVGI